MGVADNFPHSESRKVQSSSSNTYAPQLTPLLTKMPYPKQRKPISRDAAPSTTTKDARFASLSTDPRFKLPSKKHTHTKLDKRFDRILKDDEFSKKASVDRYGRNLQKDAGRKDLERLYSLEEDEDAESGEEDEVVRKELGRMDRKYDPARDGGFSESSSSEDEGSESDEDEEDLEEAELYATEEQVAQIPTGEVSRRIAVVNMDWDNVRAEDIMAVALSFLPAEGRIESVAVYPSEFGRERMDREEMEGPPKEIFASSKKEVESESEEEEDGENSDSDDDDDDDDEQIKKSLLKEDTGEEYNSTALRKYQLDRLRYYYAIITCSSPAPAQSIYEAMDGREYLSSANFFDLRFVPDETTFDEEKPRDSCTGIPRDYKPNEFVTDALRHSKVKLTWDAEDKVRKEVQKRAFSRKEIDENDLQAYIGSASSDSEDEEDADEEIPEGVDVDTMSVTSKSTVNRQARRDALRAALGLSAEPAEPVKRKGKKDGPVGNMEISFTPGLSASDKPTSVFENDPRDIEESTMEKYIRKERERKQRRKERMKARREGRDPDASASDGGNEDEVQEDEAKDLGFDDPFFMDPQHEEKEKKKAKKAAQKAREKERAKNEAASAAQRAELELVMAGDEESRMRHFDMREIQKAEKAAKLKGKLKKKKERKGDIPMQKEDGFEMNTQDPRFSRLFESHEFAIDPTNPKYKKTEGMKKLMEEGRRKRERGDVGAAIEKEKEKKRVRSGGDELQGLVEKMKKRAKKA